MALTGTIVLSLTLSGCVNKAPAPIEPAPAAVGAPAATTPAKPTAAAETKPEPFTLKEGEQLVSHTATKGDSLSSLATKYNTRVSRIKSANGLSSDMIIAGKTYKIPTAGGAAAAAPATAEAPAAPAPAPAALSPAPTPPAPAAPAPTLTPTPAPSLNFGNPNPPPAPAPAPSPAPTPPSTGGIQIKDN